MERSLEDSIKNKTYIDNLRSAAKYSKEVIDLVEADIEYGLTMEQTKLYLKRDIKFPQMKLLSQCLRKGADEAFMIRYISFRHMLMCVRIMSKVL